MKKIEAKIVADSKNEQGDRITTYLLTFPRFILAEAKTHRIISGLHGEVGVLEDISINSFREGSKNSASSRAIPFEKMVKMVQEDPFIPISWQKDHKGMQGTEYWIDDDTVAVDEGDEYERYTKIYSATEHFITEWLEARDLATAQSYELNRLGVTKQLCNRLLEPFMWHTTLISATEFDNFFELRCPKYEYYDMLTGNQQFFKSKKDWLQYYNNKPLPKAKHISKIPENDIEWLQINKSQAEIHIQALAEAMWDAMNESTPKTLQSGEWHIPFGDNIQLTYTDYDSTGIINQQGISNKIKIAVARAARLSYMTFDGEIDYEKDIQLHDRLLADKHMSPFEHCARAMSEDERAYYYKSDGPDPEDFETGWCRNFRGWIQYRHLIENKI